MTDLAMASPSHSDDPGATNPATAESGDFGPHVLREYAMLADGIRGALVGPRGDICWLCAPSWDSDAAFSSLIGGRGSFRVCPADSFVWGGHYEAGSLIWRSRWVTPDGITECREALAYPAEAHRAVIMRRIEPLPITMAFHIRLDVAAEFGRYTTTDSHRDEHGIWTGRSGPLYIRLSGAAEILPGAGGEPDSVLSGLITLSAGESRSIILEISDQPLTMDPPDSDHLWNTTESAWRQAVPAATGTMADRDVTHARAVLRGMTSPGGGMVAAATMSLPERAEQGRNYDYRYVWIRDQCIAGQAAARLGADDLLADAVRFVSERIRSDGPHLVPAYTVAGLPVPPQRSVDLRGYPGGHDIAGNHVIDQFQLDSLGEALLLFAAATRAGQDHADMWEALKVAVNVIESRWHEEEAGIWELDPHWWSHSRLMCVVGLRAISTMGGAPKSDVSRWLSLADIIESRTAQRCLHADGFWQRAVGDERPDASLLFPIIRQAAGVLDQRSIQTIRTIERELADDFLVYRFRQQPGPLGDAEGAFVLCGFSMAIAQQRLGNPVSAARYFERNRAAMGPPGLFAEEYDVEQRQLRGNLPQAFVHALLIESATQLAQ